MTWHFNPYGFSATDFAAALAISVDSARNILNILEMLKFAAKQPGLGKAEWRLIAYKPKLFTREELETLAEMVKKKIKTGCQPPES